MRLFPKVAKIILASGEELAVTDGITVIVGPNNAGKSLILRELNEALGRFPAKNYPPMRAVDKIECQPSSTFAEFKSWFEATYPLRQPGPYYYGDQHVPHYAIGSNGPVIIERQLPELWQSNAGFGYLRQAFILYISPGGAAGMAGGSGQLDILNEKPQNPSQHLYANKDLADQVSSLIKRAFNLPLTVNRYGSQITLHLGSVQSPETPPPPSADYLRELSQLPQIQEQGDGVKAFAGFIVGINTTRFSLIIIDEPETFLHPPQAYLLGQFLAEQHRDGTQVIIATHSPDIIQGITSVESALDSITIARLTRQGNINHVSQLSTEVIRDLYQDPLMKYYDIIDGLFFHGVVLCEADSDCTYYRAVADSITALYDGTEMSSIDLHFTHCGGKARLARAIRALRDANVPVSCIVDFDFLQSENEFSDIVTAVGGDPASLSALRNDIVNAITSKNKKVKRATMKAEVIQVFDKANTPELRPSELTEIYEILKPKSGWADAKLHGRTLLSGQALTSFDKINEALIAMGIFIVEVGELERFHREIPSSNKAAWLRAVLEGRLFEKSTEARRLMTTVASSIMARQ